jgi:hypothetical protein
VQERERERERESTSRLLRTRTFWFPEEDESRMSFFPISLSPDSSCTVSANFFSTYSRMFGEGRERNQKKLLMALLSKERKRDMLIGLSFGMSCFCIFPKGLML